MTTEQFCRSTARGVFRARAGSGSGPAALLTCLLWLASNAGGATSVIPISDQELYQRADVVVHGVVTSSDATVDGEGRPEMLTVIEPLFVVKGHLSGSLVLHQLGADLPDGRFLKIWGRPEYVRGSEVLVFALARPEGEFQTAELMLGKFQVLQDETGARFAVPELSLGHLSGVDVREDLREVEAAPENVHARSNRTRIASPASLDGPRELEPYLASLRAGRVSAAVLGKPVGRLQPLPHAGERASGALPMWGNISNSLYRWTNGANAGWTLSGLANMTGGGTAEATNALSTWTSDPNSTINYTLGTGNTINLNATSSSACGWSACLSGAGVIGCGGPSGGGTQSWRGDSYITISSGFVQLRSFCASNAYDSTTVQAVLTHELGHTLGLGHSDQNVSPHDGCRGDEDAAQMRSTVQHRTTLGTDDQDSIRWLYGDGLSSCTALPGPPVPTGVTPSFGSTSGGTLLTVAGSGFQTGAAITLGGTAANGVTVISSGILTATTPAHIAGTVNLVVTNPDAQSGTLVGAFTYGSGAAFYSLTPCRVVDTRNPAGPYGGPALAANTDRTFSLTGQCAIPAGARAISANITVTQSTSSGDLRLYAAGGVLPITSAINYGAGQTRANSFIAPLGSGGILAAHCDQPSGAVHLIIDVSGYYQ